MFSGSEQWTSLYQGNNLVCLQFMALFSSFFNFQHPDVLSYSCHGGTVEFPAVRGGVVPGARFSADL